MSEPPAPASVPEFALARLRADLLARHLTPGQPIRQDALAKRYGISRVPIREALNVLQSEGVVEYRPRRGWAVASLSLTDLTEVYRLRQLLETEAIRIGLPHISTVQLRHLRVLVAEIEQSSNNGDVPGMAAANRRFHLALLGCCESARLMRLITQLWDVTDAYRSLYYTDAGNRARVRREHRALIRAVAAKDADAVVAIQDEHRLHAVEALAEAIGSTG